MALSKEVHELISMQAPVLKQQKNLLGGSFTDEIIQVLRGNRKAFVANMQTQRRWEALQREVLREYL